MTHAVLAFGRMNPPTTGHEKFIKKTHDVAKKVGGTAHVVASHSEGDSKNPIPQKKKLGYIKKIAHKDVHVSGSSKQHPSILHHAAKLHAAGHQHLHVVAAGKREKEFHSLLHKYNGKKSSHGHYHFKSITVHSAGKRDPDSHDHSEGVSGTSMRQHAHDNNHKEFKKGLPKALHPHKDEIMNHIKSIKEEVDGPDQQIEGKLQDADKAKEAGWEAASKAATKKLNKSPQRQEYMRKRLASYKRTQRDQKAQTMPGFQGEDRKEDLDQAFEDLVEALNVVQRIKRKLIMRRMRPKINRAKRLFKHRKVPEKNLKQRARKAGIRFVRKRVAGKKGSQYTKLSAAAKMHIDKKVSKQQKIVTNIARRLLPRARKAELVRLQRNELEQDFADYLKERTNATTRQDGKPFEKETNPTVAAKTKHKYKEKNEKGGRAAPVTEQDLQSLYLKATKGEYPFETILEVFVRGIEDWDGGNNTPAQYAFNRVNSFVAGGKAYEMDSDLVEASSKHAADQTSYLKRKIARKSDALRSKQSVSSKSTTLFKRRHGGKTSQHRSDAAMGRSSSAEGGARARRPRGGIKKMHRDLANYSEKDFRRVHGKSKSAARQSLAKENFSMATGSPGYAQSETPPPSRVKGKKKKVLEWGKDEATAHARSMTPGEVNEALPLGHPPGYMDPKVLKVKLGSKPKPKQGQSFLQGFTDRRNKGIKSKPIDKDKFFGKRKEKPSVKEQDNYVQTKTGTHRQVSSQTWVANPNRTRRAKVHLPSDAPKKPATKAKVTGPSLQGLKPRNQRGRINNENVEEKLGFDTHTDVVANTKAASEKPKRKLKGLAEAVGPADWVTSKNIDDSGIKTTKFKSGKYVKSGAGGTTTYGKSGQQLRHSTPRIGGVKVTKVPNSAMGPGNRGISTTTNYKGKLGGTNVNLTAKDGVMQSAKASSKDVAISANRGKDTTIKIGKRVATHSAKSSGDRAKDMKSVNATLKKAFQIPTTGSFGESLDYKMTYHKHHTSGEGADKKLHKTVTHATVKFDEKPTTPERVRHVVQNSNVHKNMKKKGYDIHSYGEHEKDHGAFERNHGTKVTYEAVDPRKIPKWNAPNSGREGMSREKIVKSMIQQEKDRDARKHDRMMDKARLKDTRQKNNSEA